MDDTLVKRIIDFFGSSLIPVSSPSLDLLALPEETKMFLKSLRALDARSLDDPENWWSTILEQFIIFFPNGDRLHDQS